MANYYATSRTNLYRVTDEEKYKKLFSRLCSEDVIEDFTEEVDGELMHGFGAHSTIDYMDVKKLCEFMEEDEYDEAIPYIYVYDNTQTDKVDEDMKSLYVSSTECVDSVHYIYLTESKNECDADYDFDSFLERLQKILDPRDAFVYTEVGNEKLRYVDGFVICVTKENIRQISLNNMAKTITQGLLCNPEYVPQLSY